MEKSKFTQFVYYNYVLMSTCIKGFSSNDNFPWCTLHWEIQYAIWELNPSVLTCTYIQSGNNSPSIHPKPQPDIDGRFLPLLSLNPAVVPNYDILTTTARRAEPANRHDIEVETMYVCVHWTYMPHVLSSLFVDLNVSFFLSLSLAHGRINLYKYSVRVLCCVHGYFFTPKWICCRSSASSPSSPPPLPSYVDCHLFSEIADPITISSIIQGYRHQKLQCASKRERYTY